MDIKTLVREDLWKAINNHYEKQDYTEALRDAMFLVKDILQDKSGYTDKDNTKLVESALLGKNAAIKINKYETESEINFQEGIGFAFKGLIMHLRNPISHDRLEYTKEQAVAQLLYINYLLNQIDKSEGRQLINDWLEYLLNDNFTETESFAKELVKELHKKQYYDLLITIWRNKHKFEQNKVNNFLNELFKKLTAQEKNAFVNVMNSDLIHSKDWDDIAMFFHLFGTFYTDLKAVVKLHIEDLVKKGISVGELYKEKINGINAIAATFANPHIDVFLTKSEVLKVIDDSLFRNEASYRYINKYFYKYIDLFDENNLERLKLTVKNKLILNNKLAYDFVNSYDLDFITERDEWKTSIIYKTFEEELNKYEERQNKRTSSQNALPV